MNKIVDNILNLIYPPVCGMCGKISKENLCNKCSIKIKQYEITNKYIQIKKDMFFDEIKCILNYKSDIRKTIIQYKFNNRAYLYKTFSKIILKNKKTCGFLKKYDIIIPVPMHIKRKRKRGYNQTELIAKEIAKNIDIKLITNNLVKTKNIKSQSKLSKRQRKENVKNVFELKRKDDIKNKNILIFDDIYTTGSTVNECAKVLKNAGANKIGILTLAKD